MSCTKGGPDQFAEERITDVGNMQPISNLYGNGFVGSQAPHTWPVSYVWPFESGLVALAIRPKRDYLILPQRYIRRCCRSSQLRERCKDAVQVTTIAAHSAAPEDAGELSAFFAGATCLTFDWLCYIAEPFLTC